MSIVLRGALRDHPLLGASSASILSRASAQILRFYYELALVGSLNPCWIQLRRILTCIHIVILTCVDGHTHAAEADELLGIGVDLVARHEVCWEPAFELRRDVEAARTALIGTLRTATEEQTPIPQFDDNWMSWIDMEVDWRAWGVTLEEDPGNEL